jgi:hypothetical protein
MRPGMYNLWPNGLVGKVELIASHTPLILGLSGFIFNLCARRANFSEGADVTVFENETYTLIQDVLKSFVTPGSNINLKP